MKPKTVVLILSGLLIGLCLFTGGAVVRAFGADLPFVILHGYSKFESATLDKFGTYSARFYRGRWARMCKGPARYDAMAEAASMNKSNPCTR